MFKDLASSYLFGRDSRKLGNWFKLKEDYVARGHAADIDVVVVGGKFATGARNVGLMNSFTVACLDDDTSQGVKYMTLGGECLHLQFFHYERLDFIFHGYKFLAICILEVPSAF